MVSLCSSSSPTSVVNAKPKSRWRRILTAIWWIAILVETIVGVVIETAALTTTASFDFYPPGSDKPTTVSNPLASLANHTPNWIKNSSLANLIVMQQYQQQSEEDTSSTVTHETDSETLGLPIQPPQQQNFLQIATDVGTSKVAGTNQMHECYTYGTNCRRLRLAESLTYTTDDNTDDYYYESGGLPEPDIDSDDSPSAPILISPPNPSCQVDGHLFDSVYQKWLGPLSTSDTDPFTFLQVAGLPNNGFEALGRFLPQALKQGVFFDCNVPFSWTDMSALVNDHDLRRYHCVQNLTDVAHMTSLFETDMQTHPFRVAVDDGSHQSASTMAAIMTQFFPRLEPGGLLFLEQPTRQFRQHVLPQLLHDVNWCSEEHDQRPPCFPNVQPWLKGVHCELNICVLERNRQPAATRTTPRGMLPPANALNAPQCLFS